MKSEYIFKLNIATYLEYERLTQESYLSIDYSNVDSVKKLMYSCINANNEFPYTYNEFMKLKDKFILPYVNLFKIELKKLQQYNKEEVQESTEENTEPIFIREIVPILVKNCN